MITSTIKQLPKSTVEMEIKISWDEIKVTYEKIFDQVTKELELPGFRKGKAPKELVEKNVNKTKIFEEVIREIIPKAYANAIKEHNLQPIISPKIEVMKAKENEEWVVKATIALRPKVTLKNYKEKIREAKKPKAKIWTPGEPKEKESKETKKPDLDLIINTLLTEAEVEISDLMISEEANRLLADLLDQVRKLGMTVEQYLLAKGKTTEQLRAEYAIQASKNLSVEFILAEIADLEKITVGNEDIEKLLEKVEKPEEKEKLRKDSYYLAHLIRQQKTLDFLYNL